MIIYVPESDIRRLEEQLKNTPEQMPDVLSKSINSTAKYGRKVIVKRTRERYILKKAPSRIKEASEFERASKKNLQATIEIKSRPEPMINFSTRKNGKRASAKAKVLRQSSLKNLTITDNGKELKAFIQTVKKRDEEGNVISEHTGVFRRMTEKERAESKSTERNAIKQLYSPAIPQMVRNEEVLTKIDKDIEEELARTLDKHIAQVMEGLK